MLNKSQKTGRITEKRTKSRQFYQNARLNGHASFKTGDFGTLVAGAVLQTASLLIQSLTYSWFVKISVQRRHAPLVGNGAFSHKID